MAMSAYQLWLKKREFKTPRPPPSPISKSTTSSSLASSKGSSQVSSSSSTDVHGPSHSNFTKFHAVLDVGTTQVAVKYVARPFVVRKRPMSWLNSREEASDVDKRPHAAKVAGSQKNKVAGDKVAGLHRPCKGKEDVMKTTTLKLVSAAEVLRQSSSRRDAEREKVVSETKVATGDESGVNVADRVMGSLVQLKQVRKRKMETGLSVVDTTKRFRFHAESKVGGTTRLGGVKWVGQRHSSVQQNEVVKRKQDFVESASGDNTTKRLRFDYHTEESDRVVELSELLPKSPMKKRRKLRTAMLDESQYWLAVDRFSHLT